MRLSVVLPLIVPNDFCLWMSRFCIAALRTQAVQDFELVVVETGSRHFEDPQQDLRVDKYIHFPKRSTYVHDWNAGADIATGKYLVHIGNDVIVGQYWDAALLQPFDLYPDCGMTTLSVLEPAAPPQGHTEPLPGVIAEGFYGPLMAFSNQWRLDPEFLGGCSDNDLVMRMYEQGFRSYRNLGVVCYHMHQMTNKQGQDKLTHEQGAYGEELFYKRWRNSPLHIFSMIRAGGVKTGSEHVARCSLTPPEMRRQQQ